MNGNFTQVPNSLLECLYGSDLTSREIKVMLCIIRYTYGFHRDGAELSLSFISNATGIRTNKVSAIVKQLTEKNMIAKEKNHGFKPQVLTVAQNGNAQNGNAQNGNTLIPQKGNTHIPQNGNQEININKDINIDIDITNDNFPDDDPYSHLYADYGNF